MIIDGRAIAKDILADTKLYLEGWVQTSERIPIVRAITVASTPATESYLRIKKARALDAGMELEVVRLDDDATTEDVLQAIDTPGADAIIVQLPLPPKLEWQTILSNIPVEKDADVLSPTARARFARAEEDTLLPPVVASCAEIFARAGISPAGKKTVVIGQGMLVGGPIAVWLDQQGALVELLDKDTFAARSSILKEADIVVSGAGSPHLLTPELFKEGVVLIDAGTSGLEGEVVGDAHPSCSAVASVFTPVPGGMGPIAVACLFRNVAQLLKPVGGVH